MYTGDRHSWCMDVRGQWRCVGYPSRGVRDMYIPLCVGSKREKRSEREREGRRDLGTSGERTSKDVSGKDTREIGSRG